MKGADKLILATDPDREGEAISWHVLEVLKEKRALKDQPVERVVSTPSPSRPSPRRWPIRARSMARWSDAIWRAVRWIISSALRSRRCCGASCPVHAPPVAAIRRVAAGCDREMEIEKFVPREYWSLLTTLLTPRAMRSKRVSSARTARRFSGSISARVPRPKSSKRRSEAAAFQRLDRRSQAGAAQSTGPVHDLDLAAGSQPQTRLRTGAYDARGAAAL